MRFNHSLSIGKRNLKYSCTLGDDKFILLDGYRTHLQCSFGKSDLKILSTKHMIYVNPSIYNYMTSLSCSSLFKSISSRTRSFAESTEY